VISRRFWVHATAAATLGLFSTSSHAVLISTSANNPYAFSWSYDTAAGVLSGNGSLTVSGFQTGSELSNSLLVSVSLTNSSPLASNRLTAFGFGIDPDATSVLFSDAQGADGGMVGASMWAIPSLANVEVCAYGGNNCPGGANGGILGGGSDTFQLLLSGRWGTSVNIDPIGFKYQTGLGSFEFTTDRPPTSVPEPATLSLLGAGLLLVGFGRKRKQNQNA